MDVGFDLEPVKVDQVPGLGESFADVGAAPGDCSAPKMGVGDEDVDSCFCYRVREVDASWMSCKGGKSQTATSALRVSHESS